MRDELGTIIDLPYRNHHPTWEEVLRLDICAYCKGPGGTIDHIDPRASGASLKGFKLNGTGACSPCNIRKREMKLIYFLDYERWQKTDLKRHQKRRLIRSFFSADQVELMKQALDDR